MSLRGYKKKGKPAQWMEAFPEQLSPGVKLKPTRLRSRSKRRNPDEREYVIAAREVVEAAQRAGMKCPVVEAVPELRNGRKYGHPISDKITEVHHRYGRIGRLLLWKSGWLLVSKQGHRWIHQNPAKARELGFLCPAGCWNDYDRALKDFSK